MARSAGSLVAGGQRYRGADRTAGHQSPHSHNWCSMTNDQLKALAPYITAIISYLWRLTSDNKEHTLIRYAYLLGFTLSALLSAWFLGGGPLVLTTGCGLGIAFWVLRPVRSEEKEKSAEVRP
jgi:hypothetical protein